MASSVDTVTASSSSSSSLSPELHRAIEEWEIIVDVLYTTSSWCIVEIATDVDCIKKKNLKVFANAFAKERFIDSIEDVNLSRLALSEAANLPGWGLNYGNQMPQDGSTNWNSPPIYDVTPDESDDTDDDADEMEAHVVPDDVADAPQEAHVVPDDEANVPREAHVVEDHVANSQREAHVVEDHAANLPQGNQIVLLDSSINWDLPPRYDATPDESDDADEMVQDYVADLPLEAHVVPNDVAGVQQEAHVVEDHAANLPQACPICFTNARNMAFQCGHTTCVKCGERLDTCHFCRKPISSHIRLFLG